MQWAARGGYLYVIQLLIAHGADPTIADSQGYNSLHLVTHSSSIMPLLYLLHQPVNVDSREAQGHTALMWAAYQGDALSVVRALHVSLTHDLAYLRLVGFAVEARRLPHSPGRCEAHAPALGGLAREQSRHSAAHREGRSVEVRVPFVLPLLFFPSTPPFRFLP